MNIKNIDNVKEIMYDFAKRTGLIGEKKPKRYLWTDAFALCNFLSLFKYTKNDEFLNLAKKLIYQVHHILGKYREDDTKKGWLSGYDNENGEKHPTIAGLRIGKKLKERQPFEPFDEHLEWERDGQYFHYLTRWMHALSKMTQVTGDFTYNRWAIELAKIAFANFSYIDKISKKRFLYWKMSTDLSRPLINAMGQHDAIDGWIIYQELYLVGQMDKKLPKELDLSFEIIELKKMAQDSYLSTIDPLGIGGLLVDIC